MSNYPPPGGPGAGGYQSGGFGGGYPPPGPPSGKTKVLNLDYNVAGLLCYIPCCINVIASLIFFFTEPKGEGRFVRFHALQSLLVTVVFGVLYALIWILSFIIGIGAQGAAGEAVGCGLGLIFTLLWIIFLVAYLIINIIGMIKAYQGQMWQVPMVGGIADKNA